MIKKKSDSDASYLDIEYSLFIIGYSEKKVIINLTFMRLPWETGKGDREGRQGRAGKWGKRLVMYFKNQE